MGWNPISAIINGITNIVNVIGGVVEDFIGWLVSPLVPDIPDFDRGDQQAQGALINKQSNNAHIPVIYGTRKVGGVRVFLEVSGNDNQYLYGAIVISEGEINAITKIYVDDDEVTFNSGFSDGGTVTSDDSRFGSTIQMQTFYGTDGQSASSLLTTLDNWTANHKLSGLCYIAFRFEWDADKYTGIPKIQALVEGKKVISYNASLVAQSPAHSSNPAWCLLDYLTNTRYGKGIDVADIDLQSFYDSSQIAETQVTPYSGASTINLFDCNAYIDTSKKLIENVKVLIQGMRGFLPYTQGKYKLIIETTGTASVTLNENNIIGGLKISSEKKNEKYNRVLVDYVSPDHDYQNNTITYPETDAEHQTLKTADDGFLQEGNITLTTITNPYQALEFGEIILERSRNNLTVQCTANYEALDLAIGDIVALDYDLVGFSSKPFRIVGMSINPDFTVGLNLIEHQNSWYTFDEKTQVATLPDTNLPNPFTIEAPSISASDELISLFDGSVVSKLTVEVNSNDNFVSEYEVQIKPQGDTNFITIGRSPNKVFEKYPVIEGLIYDIRARAVNSLGVSSVYTTGQHEVNSAFLPPDDVTDYRIDVVGDKLHHFWTPVANLDLRYYEIRYTTDTTVDNYADSVVLVDRIGRPSTSVVTPYQQGGKFMLKAVDKFGVRSTNFASVIVTEQVFGEKQNTVQTITENPNFSGIDTSTPETGLTLDNLINEGSYAPASYHALTNNIVFGGELQLPSSFSQTECIWEAGGTGTGAWLGVSKIADVYYLRLRTGDGATGVQLQSDTSNVAIINVPISSIPEFDDEVHTMVWNIDVDNQFLRLWIDGRRIINYDVVANGGNVREGSAWGGTNTGGWGEGYSTVAGGNSSTADTQYQSTTNWSGNIISDLRVYDNENTSYTDKTDYNVAVSDGKLILNTALFDSISGTVDDAEGFFDGGAGTVVSSGTYDFANSFDFGAIYKSNIQINSLKVQNLNYVNNFDSKDGLFDSAEGLFDGGENASVNTNVELLISTSDNGTNFSSYKTFKAGDYNTRAFKFRALLTSSSAEETPVVEELSLNLSVPKRSEEGSNIVSGTDIGGKTITFINAFYQIPTVTVIAQDLQTGDYFNLNSKTAQNFNIEFFNSGGTTVSRTFDYQVIGIGQQQ